ncbi:Disks large-associated protein 2, partial [Ophiophagus hannah]
MKGLSGSRNQSQLCSAHTCGLASPEDCEHSHDHLHHGQESRQSYLLSPTESCPVDHHRCSPRSSIHSECMMMPMVMGDHMSSSTFPRMHYTSHYDTRDDCTMTHANPKINRIPANLLDQFEKQLPLHRDGFHTLQYQRTSTAAEQRSESPGRIRHLVHSVQKLFTKSHSLEGSSKSNVNGAKGDGRGDDHHHGHHSKHSKRSKSKERKPESKHKTGMSSWWSSDDNLDSDSTYRTPSVVPQDEWGGYPAGGKDEEIPCRRMRSGSYIKAMGDEESGDSDSSPKTSPKFFPTLFLSFFNSQSYLQATSEVPGGHTLDPSANYNSPKFRSRNQSYMRAVSTLSQASCVSQMSEAEVNGQFESVCESVFSEVEAQAMDALGLPGCFRTRSHSYLRAIQAGYSQDDESVTYTSYKKTPPPVPPRTTSKPLISITAQSSTESTQDAYQDSRTQGISPWPQDGLRMYNSTDSLDSNKAMNLAMETAAAQRHMSDSQISSVRTSDKAILVTKAEEFLKSRRSSIGIQVEAATDSDTDSKGLREYHSVGVQVEDDKRHGRFKRSNSVTAAVQADLELEGFPGHITMEDKGLQFGGSFQRHSEPSTPTQYGAVRTVRTQGLFSYREDYRTQVDTSNLPPPEPWLEPSMETIETGRMSPCRRDGSWFMKLLHTETKRMEGWCKEMEREAEENDLSEESKIRSAVGSAQLLMSQKFQQFYWLCQQNLEERKVPPPVPKKPPKGKFPITREKSLDLPDRQRQEARRRLMAAKRAASFRQNSATERADSIEIYIPEAQTRL